MFFSKCSADLRRTYLTITRCSYTFTWGWAIGSYPITSQRVLRQDNGGNQSPTIFTELQQNEVISSNLSIDWLNSGIPLLKPSRTVIVSHLTSSHKNWVENLEQCFSGIIPTVGCITAEPLVFPVLMLFTCYLAICANISTYVATHRITLISLRRFSIMHTIACTTLSEMEPMQRSNLSSHGCKALCQRTMSFLSTTIL